MLHMNIGSKTKLHGAPKQALFGLFLFPPRNQNLKKLYEIGILEPHAHAVAYERTLVCFSVNLH